MRTIPLGTTDTRVSVICLGTMYYGWRTDPETSISLLDQYVAAGGTFLDTANIYGSEDGRRVGGISEALVGRWMKARGNRATMFVATKVGFEREGVQRGLRAEQIVTECERSLKALQTDAIDLYYAHVDDRQTPLEETLQAFERLVSTGKVRYIGASNYLAWRLAAAHCVSQANGWADYCCVQQRHTYLRPVPGARFGAQIAANDDLLDYCRSTRVQLLAYSPLLGGSYTREDKRIPDQYRGPDSDARLEALRAVAEQSGATLHQVVLAWMMQGDPPVIPLAAGSTPEQLRENLGALDVSLSADQLVRLAASGSWPDSAGGR